MSQENSKRIRRKVRNSYIVSTISIALVLFLLGSVGYLILNALTASNQMREQVSVYLMLRNNVSEEQRAAIESKLKGEETVREFRYIGKAEAAAEFKEYLHNDFEEFLESNPLPDSYELKMKAESCDQQSIAELEKRAGAWDGVLEVVYQRNVVEQIFKNLNTFNMILLVFGAGLLLISLILLHNTIRVSIFAKRFIINTMKLVGATDWFIMKQFIGSSILQGIYAGIISSLMFVGLLAGLSDGLPEIRFIMEQRLIGMIIGGMVVGGVLISVTFTIFAVRKFVRMHTNKIYLY